MALLDLPAELLDEIIKLVFLDKTFRSFALSSKATYKACESYIPRYNALVRKWEDVRLTGSHCEVKTVVALVQSVLRDPDIAYFIQKLDLRSGVYTDDDEMKLELRSAVELKRLMEDSPYFASDSQYAQHWRTVMFADATELADQGIEVDWRQGTPFATTVLLSLLPNVVELTLPEEWSDFSDIASGPGEVLLAMIEDLRRAVNTKSPADMPLGKLQHLHPHEEGEYDPQPRSALTDLAHFLGLPSLTHFHAVNLIAVDDGYTGIPFDWPFPKYDSNVRHVELEAGCIDADSIGKLLKHTPQLKSLTYSHYTKWHGCLHDWDAGAFVKAVAVQLSGTLTQLSVTVDNMFGEVETGVASMKDFRALEDITLDVRLFCGPPPESGASLGIAGTGPLDWTLHDIPHLCAILPSSVRTLKLISRDDDNARDAMALRQLLGGSKELIASHDFPYLEKLIVVCPKLDLPESQDARTDLESEASAEEAPSPSLRALVEHHGGKWVPFA